MEYRMPLKRWNRQACLSRVVLTLACLVLIASTDSQALAQASGASGKCEQPPILYALAHYKVEHVTVKPMVRFISNAALLNEALTDAIAVNVPGSKGVWVSR